MPTSEKLEAARAALKHYAFCERSISELVSEAERIARAMGLEFRTTQGGDTIFVDPLIYQIYTAVHPNPGRVAPFEN